MIEPITSDYQHTAADDLRNAWLEGCKSNIIHCPTGGGKTRIAGIIAKKVHDNGHKIGFVVHTDELVSQSVGEFESWGIKTGVIKAGYPSEPWKPLQVISAATLAKRFEQYRGLGLAKLFLDECHRSTEKIYKPVFDLWPDAFKTGLSATPFRSDGRGLGDLYGRIIFTRTIDQLIDLGRLVPVKVFRGEPIDFSDVKIDAKTHDYNIRQMDAKVNQPAIIGDMVKAWLEHGENRLTIVFARSIAHSKNIVEKFNSAGVPAVHMDGNMKPDDRRETLRLFRTGQAWRVISNANLFVEGIDIPELSCLIISYLTKSRGRIRQQYGRVLRAFPGKEYALVLDHASATLRESDGGHGWPTESDDFSLDGVLPNKKERKPKYCPHCDAEYFGNPRFCPACAAELREAMTPAEIQEIAARMVEVQRPERKPDVKRETIWSYDMAREWYFRDRQHAFEHGFKPGYAGSRYKARMNKWPPWSWNSESEPKIGWNKETKEFFWVATQTEAVMA